MLDVGEDILIGAHYRRRLILVRDLLAEDVDRRELPLCVDAPDGLARVSQLGSGDVPRGELLHERPRDGRKHANDRAVEDRQGRRSLSLAHETLTRRADKRDRLREEHPHGVAKRD